MMIMMMTMMDIEWPCSAAVIWLSSRCL